MNPSPWRAARRMPAGALPPNQTGGCGFCTGLGSIVAPCSFHHCPSKSISDSVQHAFRRASASLKRATGLSGWTPNSSNGRATPPVAIPTSTRPWLRQSRELIALARWSGLCSGSTNTAQPSRSCSVQAAAKVSVWSGARLPAAPITCSWTQAPSNRPSSSTRRRWARKASPSKRLWRAYCGMEIAKRIRLRPRSRPPRGREPRERQPRICAGPTSLLPAEPPHRAEDPDRGPHAQHRNGGQVIGDAAAGDHRAREAVDYVLERQHAGECVEHVRQRLGRVEGSGDEDDRQKDDVHVRRRRAEVGDQVRERDPERGERDHAQQREQDEL